MLSALMMILSLPFSIPIALTIKLEDRGPVFYRQERRGRGREALYPFQSTDYADPPAIASSPASQARQGGLGHERAGYTD